MQQETWTFTNADGDELVITMHEHPDPTVEPEDIEVEINGDRIEDGGSWDGARDLILTRLIPKYQAKGWTLTHHRPMS